MTKVVTCYKSKGVVVVDTGGVNLKMTKGWELKWDTRGRITCTDLEFKALERANLDDPEVEFRTVDGKPPR